MSREFEVLLEGGAPWGFRLHGGKEFRLPLRVAKVEVGGKAHAAGVKVDDKVIEINGKNVENLYHTEALVAVKRASERLYLRTKREVSDETKSQQAPDPSPIEQDKKIKDTEMIQIKSFPPAMTVPMKPASATSIPVDQAPHVDAQMQLYSDELYYGQDGNEWSPDMINEIVRTPDPISISKEEDPYTRRSDSAFETSYDATEAQRTAPQAPLSPVGFEKARPVGRGRRRLTSSGSSSFDHYEHTNDVEEEQQNDLPQTLLHTSMDMDMQSNSALRHLQSNKVKAGYNIPRSGSLPRSLGKKMQKDMDNKSSTLPRKKSQGTPTWYKEMYNEIHKTMAGQSQLSRLLTADAAKGAFRDYDGASSTSSLGRKPRPKSIHVDRFVFENVHADGGSGVNDTSNRIDMDMQRLEKEKQEKRYSVHSTRYREFQRGGEIPSSGLADTTEDNVFSSSTRFPKPTHARSRSQDDLLSGSSHGLPYQKSDRGRENREPYDPVKFEYNNPPDFLDLRRKAEAEGTLREERERELRMLQEARKKWLEEEEEMRKHSTKQIDAKKRLESEKQKAFQAEEQRRRFEYEMQQKKREEEEQRQREYEIYLQKENARKEAKLANDTSNGHFLGRAKGLYSFKPQSPSEIGFNKGDIVNVIKQVDENWYEGEIHGDVGIFPVSYVEMVEEEPAPSQEPQMPDAQETALQIEEGLARAKYTFQAENEEELSFKKNDMVTLLRQLDDNWYEGEIGDRIGIFPVAYVEVLKNPKVLEKNVVSGDLDVIHHEVREIEERNQGRMLDGLPQESVQNMSNHVQNNAESGYSEPIRNVSSDSEHKEPSTTMRSPAWEGERHRAVFGYSSMNQDELSLKEGDIVYVLEKCDDGWFVGTCERSGLFGTFPGNYVVPV